MVKKIKTGFLLGNFNLDDNAHVAGCASNYANELKEDLEKTFPGAEVEINYQFESGVKPTSLKTYIELDGEDYNEEDDPEGHVRTIEEIAQALFEDSNRWYVTAYSETSKNG